MTINLPAITISHDVILTIAILSYLFTGFVIAFLKFYEDSFTAGMGHAFGWGGPMAPIIFYVLLGILWPIPVAFTLLARLFFRK